MPPPWNDARKRVVVTTPNSFFVELTENRLQQSLARITSTDNRALGLLGFIAVLMTGLWAVYFSPTSPSSVVRSLAHDQMVCALIILFVSLTSAGYSLLLTAQYDNPDMTEFYREYYGAQEDAYPAYFASAIRAIRLNNAIAHRKSQLLLLSTWTLFLAVLVIMV